MRWIYGLDRLHRVASKTQREKLMASALELGASGFDVAPMYGNGIGESVLGSFLANTAVSRERLVVNTKFGIPYVAYGLLPGFMFKPCRAIDLVTSKILRLAERRCYSAAFMENSVNESLKRLKTDYIDTLFIHEPLLRLEQAEELLSALGSLRAKGKILKTGVSGGYPCVTAMACDLRLDVLQAPPGLLKDANGFSGELNAYHIRRALNAQPNGALSLADYYATAKAVRAETVLFQTTQLPHLKLFSGA